MSKKINGLTAASDAQVADATQLWMLGDPATGQLYAVTGTQIKARFSLQKKKYVATGAEGTTITISELAGMQVLSITREGQGMNEVSSAPDTTEFIWATPNITLGLAANPGERFLILYQKP